jgi:hypothetical protein
LGELLLAELADALSEFIDFDLKKENREDCGFGLVGSDEKNEEPFPVGVGEVTIGDAG